MPEIAAAETAGTLGPGRAATLRAELDADTARRDRADAGAGRVAHLLAAGSRPDPNNPGHRADMAHHFEATLRPALAELGPAQKAAAIGAYVNDTGIAPDAALDTLLGLTVAGEPEGRIAAARALTDLLVRDPGMRNRVPPGLAGVANLIGRLAGTDAIPPDEIIRAGDGLIRELLPLPAEDRPNPGLRLLAGANEEGAPGTGASLEWNAKVPTLDASTQQMPQFGSVLPEAGTADPEAGGSSLRLAQATGNEPSVPDGTIAGIIPNLKPTTEIVDVEKMYRTFQFDPDGPGQYQEAIRSPLAGYIANRAANEAEDRAEELFKAKVLTFREANAFQHALWSFEVTRRFGPELAKKLGDAHERTEVNIDGERLKDLFNNNAGRVLATDPANRNRPGGEVILEAIRAGKLQIDPVREPPPRPGVLQPSPRRSPL